MSHVPNFSVIWGVFPSLLRASFGAGTFHLSDEVLELRCWRICASDFSIPLSEYAGVGFIFLMFRWETVKGIRVPEHGCLGHFRCLHVYCRRLIVSYSPRAQLPPPHCCLTWATWSNFEAGLNLSRGVDVMTSKILFHPMIGQFHVPGWVSEMVFHPWMRWVILQKYHPLSTSTVQKTWISNLDLTHQLLEGWG